MILEKKEDIYSTTINRKESPKTSFLLISDIHFDSTHCDRELLKRHCQQAKDKNAHILLFGDIFDAMGGKYDKRSSKKDIRPEYQVEDYFNAIIDDAYEFFKDYPVCFVSEGNHESSIRRIHEISLTKMLAKRLNVTAGKYSGFIRFYIRNITHQESSRQSYDLYYSHGSGGSSPVTRGVIKTSRRQVAIEADIMVSGHIHNAWDVEIVKITPTASGKLKRKKIRHISLGTYKDDTFSGDFASEKEFAPPNLGGYWLEFNHDNYYSDFNLVRTM